MPDAEVLTRDPVFQVNSCLWLVWQTDASLAEDQPSYHSAGFRLRAISLRLSVPPRMREQMLELGWSPSPPQPDLLFIHLPSSKHLVLECKASSFSADSSTAGQARKLLTLCADCDACAGARGALVVTYVVPSQDAERQLETLARLSKEITELGVTVADSGALGLSIEDGGLWATLTVLEPQKHAELGSVEGRVKITDGVGYDARPLYIIPYDPAAAECQDPAERQYCAQQLSERILNFATGVVGRASVPGHAVIDPVDAMRSATLGVSDYWQNNEAELLRKRIEDELFRVLHRGDLEDSVHRENKRIHVTLISNDRQRDAIGLLQKAQSRFMAEKLADPQLPFTPDPADTPELHQ